MNELFATIDDALIVLGKTAPDHQDEQTADQQPRTIAAASNRLARMIGLDRRTVDQRQAMLLGRQIVDAARQRITAAFTRIDRGGPVIVSGHGHELIDLPVGRESIDLGTVLGTQAARCAPALAVAQLRSSATR